MMNFSPANTGGVEALAGHGTPEKSSGARILSLDSGPRISARKILDYDDLTAMYAGPGDVLAAELNRLVRDVKRQARDLPITRRRIFITYEEAVEWEAPPPPPASAA